MLKIISFEKNKLVLLDQRKLPKEIKYVKLSSTKKAACAISDMAVRGAPAIGIAAAYGYCLGCNEKKFSSEEDLVRHMARVKETLMSSRPTAVNLKWALDNMEKEFKGLQGLGQNEIYKRLVEAADKIKDSEIQANRTMGEYGAETLRKLIKDNGKITILTHCNAGALATGGWGTAVGVIRSAHEKGLVERVYADETRPRLQGARLTCFELKEANIPYRLISDNMSGLLMCRNKINAVIVGADRIAANGDVANKIGTYMVAVLARRHNIPFYVAAPKSTFDFNTPAGDDIEIEERSEKEVLCIGKERISPEGTIAENPAFDITPRDLVTAYITEEGVINGPDELQ